MKQSRTQFFGKICSQLLLVLAGVGVLCHLDSVLDAFSTPGDIDTEMQSVDAPGFPRHLLVKDNRAEALSGFIQARYKTSANVADKSAHAALQSSRETGLPATLILAVAAIESSFNPLSDNGIDKGIMQVNPKMHPAKVAAIGGVSGLFDITLGIHTGALILKEYTHAERNNFAHALQRYNGASTFEYSDKVLKEKGRFDQVVAQLNNPKMARSHAKPTRRAVQPQYAAL